MQYDDRDGDLQNCSQRKKIISSGNFDVVTRMVTTIDLSGFYKDNSSSLGARRVNMPLRRRRMRKTIEILHYRNYGETGTSEELWDRLGRQMEIARMNRCITRQSVV